MREEHDQDSSGRVFTHHFYSVGAAERFFADQTPRFKEVVAEKISAGEIVIGPPPDRVGYRTGLSPIVDRYWIEPIPGYPTAATQSRKKKPAR